MNLKNIIGWLKPKLKKMHGHQIKTLSALVEGLIYSKRVGLAAIAQGMRTTVNVRHCIKRVDRFLGNSRVDVQIGMRALAEITWLRSKLLKIAVDWTDKTDFMILTACVCGGWGRALPICWSVCAKGDFEYSQNRYEHEFFLMLKAVVICDRGFGRAELATKLREMGFMFIVRVKGNVMIRSKNYTGKLEKFPLVRGKIYEMREIDYREKNSVKVDLILTWQRRQKEPWYLMTNLKEDGSVIVKWYGKRMQIEEFFRDGKNPRWGFDMRFLKLSTEQRYERLLLVMAFAYLFLTLLGAWAEHLEINRQMVASTTKRRVLSLFRLGCYCTMRGILEPPQRLEQNALILILDLKE